MREETNRQAVNEDELVVPDVYRAQALGMNPEQLRQWFDAVEVAVMLDDADPNRAFELLEATRATGYLLQLGAGEFRALGLSETECARFLALPGLASKLLNARTKVADPCTRAGLAREITDRALQTSQNWDQVVSGVVAWDAQGRRVVDRILAIGTRQGANLDLRQALRFVVAAGAVSMVLWVYQPIPQVQICEADHRTSDELRILAAPLGVIVEDVFLLCTGGNPVSMAMLEGWSS